MLPATLLVWLFGSQVMAATFVVTNAADAGTGSLRSAITNANYNPGPDTIAFNVAGQGVHTINLASALPTLIEPVVIDGATQPGYAGLPLIEVNGASAGASPGLRLVAAASGSTIRALALNRFGSHGIQVDGGSSNVFVANFIGTDPSGTVARGNSLEGIYVNGSFGNTIGGLTAAERNLISGNGDAGIYILNGSSNTVLGNNIGTSLAGSAALGNGNNGIIVYAAPGLGASGNRIGRAGGRNIISGNRGSGIYLNGPGVTGNFMQANYIGVNSSGSGGLSNLADGISLQGVVGNLIGGMNEGEGNVISANGKAGVSLSSATNNSIAGNFIGIDAAGRLGLGNTYAGITLTAARSNTIGGASISARNVVAANLQDGIFLTTNASANIVAGNLIGLSAAGTNALPNLYNGISINAASSNTIGGSLMAKRNVISGNANYGVELFGGSSGNQIVGNFIGPATNGMSAMPNHSAGIFITGASGNLIDGNLLSGNGDAGIYIVGRTATGNVIQANRIGTDVSGNSSLPNIFEGIYIEAAPSNTIGGSLSGSGNLLSGNSTRGIYLTNAPWTVIQGNLLGTRADGISPLANGVHNLECESGATNVVISANISAYAASVYCGVRIRPGAMNNRIVSNSIFGNGALGIDLGSAGATLNDHCDSDTGANLQQNFPVLTQAVSGVVTGIRGTLDASTATVFVLQFFGNPACDPSGYGEGQVYLGDASVMTGASCTTSFLLKLPVSLPPGYAITATATDQAGNTSEFSACITVTGVPRLNLGITNRQATLSWSNNPSGFVLKETSNLAPPVHWTTVTNVPTSVSGVFSVTLPLGPTNRFFLLSFE
jgi:parallel beta-helix repeat protein